VDFPNKVSRNKKKYSLLTNLALEKSQENQHNESLNWQNNKMAEGF
jgi:hypothetical protein